jgi:hypothetical protein
LWEGLLGQDDHHTLGADGAVVSGYSVYIFLLFFIEKHIYNSNQKEMPQPPQIISSFALGGGHLC